MTLTVAMTMTVKPVLWRDIGLVLLLGVFQMLLEVWKHFVQPRVSDWMPCYGEAKAMLVWCVGAWGKTRVVVQDVLAGICDSPH
jgi:hypothetical protein